MPFRKMSEDKKEINMEVPIEVVDDKGKELIRIWTRSVAERAERTEILVIDYMWMMMQEVV